MDRTIRDTIITFIYVVIAVVGLVLAAELVVKYGTASYLSFLGIGVIIIAYGMFKLMFKLEHNC